MRTAGIALLIFLLCGRALPAWGQSSFDDPVEPVRSAYESLDYTLAERLGRTILEQVNGLRPDQLVEIHTFLALIDYSQNDPEGARTHFMAALSLNPSLELDPVLVSPVIRGFFTALKEETLAGERTDAQLIRYIAVQDARPAAALRSMLLPGWGQWYKRDHVKGGLFGAAFLGAAGAAAAAHLTYRRRLDRYEAETDPDLVPGRYDDANGWYRTRNGLLVGAAVVWAAAYVDALIFGAPEGEYINPETSVTFTPYSSGRSVGLRMNW